MTVLNVQGVKAIQFEEDVIQTLDGKTFTHFAGAIIVINPLVTSITLDIATNVACMTELVKGSKWDAVMQGFSVDEIRAAS